MKILVTGGLGFIGSHTVVELQNAGYEVVVIDDLSNASVEVLDGIEAITGKKPEFEKLDLRDRNAVSAFFKKYADVSGAIHFAASKAVGESVHKPLLYYENNLSSLVYLLKELTEKASANFIFSSSCTVYGQADELPITENAPVKPAESPYGNTKQIGEEIIRDTAKVYENFNAIALRYFNPIGAHESVEIGELPLGVPQNLVPFITQTAAGLRDELSVFGNDYPTEDGTCVRDYVHVMDLADAHIKALNYASEQLTSEVFNLGSGAPASNKQLLDAVQKHTGKMNIETWGNRPGDPAYLVADIDKAKNILQWEPKQSSIDNVVATAVQWYNKTHKKEIQ